MTQCPEPAKAFDHANTVVACYKHDTFQQSCFSNWSYIFKNHSLVYLHIKNITNETSAKVMVKVRIKVTKKKHWFLVLLPAIISSVPPVFSSSSVKRWQIIWWYIFLSLVRTSMTKCFWLHDAEYVVYLSNRFYFLWYFMNREKNQLYELSLNLEI